MKMVRIVRDPGTIKLLADLVRRDILRLISAKPLTQTQLAKRILLTEPSVYHHLQILSKAGLIRIKLSEVGPHGILEKYYEPTAKLFIEDWEMTPLDLRRYFVHNHMERLRGMLSVFQLMADQRGKGVEVGSEEIEGLAQVLAKHVTQVGEKYEDVEVDVDRETLLIRIYSETLKIVMAEDRWKKFFLRMKNPPR